MTNETDEIIIDDDAKQEESQNPTDETALLESRIAELEAALADEKRASAMRENEITAARFLAENGLPQSLASFAVCDDGKAMMNKLTMLKDAVDSAVSIAVTERLSEMRRDPKIHARPVVTRDMIRALPVAELQKLGSLR